MMFVCLPLVVFGSWLLGDPYQRWPDHSFRVLEGIAPISDETHELGWGMNGLIIGGLGRSSDDGSPSRFRQIEYVFKANYDHIKQELENEAVDRGSKPSDGGQKTDWRTSEDVSVRIEQGRYDPKTGMTHDEPGWVRVTLRFYRSEGNQGYISRWVRNTFRL